MRRVSISLVIILLLQVFSSEGWMHVQAEETEQASQRMEAEDAVIAGHFDGSKKDDPFRATSGLKSSNGYHIDGFSSSGAVLHFKSVQVSTDSIDIRYATKNASQQITILVNNTLQKTVATPQTDATQWQVFNTIRVDGLDIKKGDTLSVGRTGSVGGVQLDFIQLGTNTAPVPQDHTVSVWEDEPIYIFIPNDFPIQDADSNELLAIMIESLPVDGKLKKESTDVKVGDVIYRSEFNKFRYISKGTPSSFRWTAFDGVAWSDPTATLSLEPKVKLGDVYAFGAGTNGKLGQGDLKSHKVPVLIGGLSYVRTVSAGSNHSLLATEDGSLYSFGYNGDSQLGFGPIKTSSSKPTLVSDISDVVQVVAGSQHSLILTKSGDVYVFGKGQFGQLGLGKDKTSVDVPTKINSLPKMKAISTTYSSNLLLADNGDVYAFGSNNLGQLGLNSQTDAFVPTKISGISNAAAVSTGGNSLILLENGDVYSFGYNYGGNLGYVPNNNYVLKPQKISTISNAIAIATGARHSLVLLANGDVYSFGKGESGQLGHGDTKDQTTPKRIANLPKARAIAAGGDTSFVLSENGDVYSFGKGSIGHDDDILLTPKKIEGLPPALLIEAGTNHAFILAEADTTKVPVSGVTLDQSALSFTLGDSAITLQATVAPGNATNKNVTWSSSNPVVAKVDSDGVVTAVSKGTATITVTTVDGGKTATATVTVDPKKYNVTYEGNGHTGGDIPSGSAYEFDDVVTISGNTGSLVRQGYTFGGWSRDSGRDYAPGQTFYMPDQDLTLNAKWILNMYTVTYNGNGNTSGTVPSLPKDYVLGQDVNVLGNINSLLKMGYTFDGWNTQADGLGTNYPADATLKIPANDVTLYAQWEAISYSVTYDANFDSDSTATGSVPDVDSDNHYLESITVASNSGNLSREGYNFVGWNTATDGNGTDYVAGQTFAMPAENLTLYAKWIEEKYNIVYNGNGNTGGQAPVAEEYSANQEVTVTNEGTLQRMGYTFAGWNTATNGSGTSYTTGQKFNMPTENLVLYAQWEPSSYTVSYNRNVSDDDTATPVDTSYNYLESVTVLGAENLSKTGFTFAGWNTKKDGSGTDYAVGATFNMPADDVTLYAQWTANLYTVTYHGNGNTSGSAPVDSKGYKYRYNYYFLIPEAEFARTGYSLIGWNTQADGNGFLYDFGNYDNFAMPDNDVTLYAQWVAIPYTVTYDAGDHGTISSTSESVDYGEFPTAVPNVTAYDGYSFEGWSRDGETPLLTHGQVASVRVKGDITYTAFYSEVINDSVINPTSASFDKNIAEQADVTAVMTLNGNTLLSISNVGTPLTAGEDYTVNENTVSIKKEYLATQSEGFVELTFTFSAGATKTFTIFVGDSTIASPPPIGNDDDHDNDEPAPFEPGTPATPEQSSSGIDVFVNGRAESAGTATTQMVNNQKVTTIAVDPQKLSDRLAKESNGALISIPAPAGSDVVVGELNGQMVNSMEQKQAVLEIKTEQATYSIPAEQINIQSVSGQFGQDVDLGDIKIQIEIATPIQDTVSVVENSADLGGFAIVVPPLNFTVKAVHGDSSVEIAKFDVYVERTVAIPEGVDPNKITTGVVVEPDGTVRHVPTKIVIIDGKYYAKINSLTNSTYTVVWHPIEFKDVVRHWAKQAINDMGSRMVINGTGNGLFSPDRNITRAEFAAILVRGLGLKLDTGASPFEDVRQDAWYNSAIKTAYAYGLVTGYTDGTFGPNDTITREQAMVMMARAMEITGLKKQLPPLNEQQLLSPYSDVEKVASWSKSSVLSSLQAGIIMGRTDGKLAPKSFITRAEVAVIIQRLLQKSDLI